MDPQDNQVQLDSLDLPGQTVQQDSQDRLDQREVMVSQEDQVLQERLEI